MATVSKRQLANRVAAGFDNVTQVTMVKIIDQFFGCIAAGLVANKSVTVADLGVFNPKIKQARIARNPKTGEPAEVTSRVVATFSASAALNNSINKDKGF